MIYKNRKDVVIKTLLRSFRRFFIHALYERSDAANPDMANSNTAPKADADEMLRLASELVGALVAPFANELPEGF